MAAFSRKHVFQGSVEDVFRGLNAYEQFVDNLPGVKHVERLAGASGDVEQSVRFELQLVKHFHYVLNLKAEAPHRIDWDLESSNLLKKNTGSWILHAESPETTLADYTLDMQFKGWIPSSVTDPVIKGNVDATFAGLQRIIDASRQTA